METVVTVSSKYQIVIPKEARLALNVSAGDSLLVEVAGDRIVLRRRPESYARALRGLHRHVWRDDAADYLRAEKDSWDR